MFITLLLCKDNTEHTNSLWFFVGVFFFPQTTDLKALHKDVPESLSHFHS